MQVINATCWPNLPLQPWQNWSLPAEQRVADLVARLNATEMIGNLVQNAAAVVRYPTDLRGHLNLPRYFYPQECLAGYNGGSMFLAPPLPTVATSAFPHSVNMGNTFDATLVRRVADAISSEARAVFHNPPYRPSLSCMSPVLNLARDPRWGRTYESFSVSGKERKTMEKRS